MVDPQYIERIRSATFRVARRGYDKREVDRFLSQLAEWLETGGDDDARAETVRHELERIGQQTTKILTDAHDVAEGLRSEGEATARTIHEEADAYAAQTRSDADAYGKQTRSEADAHAERVRIEADEYASETRGEAEADVTRIRNAAEAEAREKREQTEQLAEDMSAHAAHRRRELEASIDRLEERRAAVLAEMDRLSSELSGKAIEYRPQSMEELEPDEPEGPDFEHAYRPDDDELYDESPQTADDYEAEEYDVEDESVVVEVDEAESDGDEPAR